jgi:hypothetical protein
MSNETRSLEETWKIYNTFIPIFDLDLGSRAKTQGREFFCQVYESRTIRNCVFLLLFRYKDLELECIIYNEFRCTRYIHQNQIQNLLGKTNEPKMESIHACSSRPRSGLTKGTSSLTWMRGVGCFFRTCVRLHALRLPPIPSLPAFVDLDPYALWFVDAHRTTQGRSVTHLGQRAGGLNVSSRKDIRRASGPAALLAACALADFPCSSQRAPATKRAREHYSRSL